MTYTVGMLLGVLVLALAIGGLLAPTKEARELLNTGAFLVGFWTILLAILL